MLTLFYASATLLQSWRIKCACNKLAEQIAQQSSIVFYVMPVATNNGFDPCLATSELCLNRNLAKVTEVLWLQGRQRGCCLRPMQLLHISPWISFNVAPSLLPFAYEETPESVLKIWSSVDQKLLRLLLEAEVHRDKEASEDFVRIEEYGKLIAWRIDSHLAILLETNIECLTKLLIRTYLQNNLHINDNLRLLRIQSIKDEGTPQPLHLVASHTRKPTRTSIKLSDEEWEKHLEGLRSLCVLASQATEFEYKQNLTEGKTGVVKPDLIPSEKKKKEELNASPKTTEKNNKTPVATVIDGTRFTSTKVESPIKAASATAGLSSKESSPNKLNGIEKGKEQIIEIKTTSINSTKTVEHSTSSSTSILQPKPKPKEEKVETKPPLKNITAIPVPTTTTKITENVSVVDNDAKRPALQRSKGSFPQAKPLNILVYSDSVNARESVINTLKDILEDNTYTIYQLTAQQAELKSWMDSTVLLIVCGSVSSTPISQILVDYFLLGGQVLSICSDILHFILPNYRTAEIREHELVQFSYDKWQKVKMMHHIFCYQPSPVKKNFSTDSEDSTHLKKQSAMLCPRFMEVKDLRGDNHNLDVQILCTEETWQTPSILLAKSTKSGGRALFSQVHLETNPIEFEDDETKYSILKQNDKIRLDILCDLLSKYLDMRTKNITSVANQGIVYKNAYFLGYHESKFQLLNKLKAESGSNIIRTPGLTMQFCGAEDKPIKAESNVLPILIHSCPEDFSTVEYFDNLQTNYVGRLVIYAPIISTSMDVVEPLELTNGIAVIVRQQTNGVGRSGNQWLSPLGCAMSSLQLHIKLDSNIGQHAPMIQHLIGLAIVNAFKCHEHYKVLNLAIKWPNDIYFNGNIKLGGVLLKTSIIGELLIVNVGFALNLDNSKPTCCINDIINEMNRSQGKQIPRLTYEKLLALIFNEIEKLIDQVQNEGVEGFFDLYQQSWLHTDQDVKIVRANGKEVSASIIGVDDNGYLRVKLKSGDLETVQPDGNSFDMLKGLIVPKCN